MQSQVPGDGERGGHRAGLRLRRPLLRPAAPPLGVPEKICGFESDYNTNNFLIGECTEPSAGWRLRGPPPPSVPLRGDGGAAAAVVVHVGRVATPAEVEYRFIVVFTSGPGGEFDCSVEKSVDFSVEIYCTKKLNL